MFIRIVMVLMLGVTANAQVGIATTNPNATLDINGNLKIRAIPEEVNAISVKDSVMVINQGFVKSLPTTELLKAALPTTVKGSFSGSGLVNLTLISGLATIPFSQEAFDTNDEFDTTTNTFTAKQDGIYVVAGQIKASNIAVATNFGIAILKNGTVENRNGFANIGIGIGVGINVTPPIRRVETLLQLTTGDTITFAVESTLGSLNLLGTTQDSFFTIYQIR